MTNWKKKFINLFKDIIVRRAVFMENLNGYLENANYQENLNKIFSPGDYSRS